MTKQPPTVGDIWVYSDAISDEHYLVLEYIKWNPLDPHGADTVSMLHLQTGRVHSDYPTTRMCVLQEWRQVA